MGNPHRGEDPGVGAGMELDLNLEDISECELSQKQNLQDGVLA